MRVPFYTVAPLSLEFHASGACLEFGGEGLAEVWRIGQGLDDLGRRSLNLIVEISTEHQSGLPSRPRYLRLPGLQLRRSQATGPRRRDCQLPRCR